MLTTVDKKDIQKIVGETVLKVIKNVLMPTLQNMDKKSDKIDAKVDKLTERVDKLTERVDKLTEVVDLIDIKTDEIILNQKKDDKRIQRLEKSLTVS